MDPYAVHPGVAQTWGYIEQNVLERGVVEQEVKELCLRYVTDDVDLSAHDGRERAALEWTHAIVWDSAQATDELWERLRSFFSDAELVDLGCAVGFALGLDHFRRTLHAATS